MATYKLKINNGASSASIISAIRKYDSSLSVSEIKRRIEQGEDVAGFAALGGDGVEDFDERIVFDSRNEFVTRNFALEAAIQDGVRVAVEDVPHFAFAALSFVEAGVVVGRVDLHGKIVVRVD